MSNALEKNFSGFVKVVIGATELLAMGAVVAAGALIKGFKEGAKTIKDALNDQDKTTDTKKEKAESSDTTDETARDTTDDSKEEN